MTAHLALNVKELPIFLGSHSGLPGGRFGNPNSMPGKKTFFGYPLYLCGRPPVLGPPLGSTFAFLGPPGTYLGCHGRSWASAGDPRSLLDPVLAVLDRSWGS